jgi:hypothetical protein
MTQMLLEQWIREIQIFSSEKKYNLLLSMIPKKKTINFFTNDEQDQTYTTDLYDSSCNVSPGGLAFSLLVREGVIEGNAFTEKNAWFVDGPLAGFIVSIESCLAQLIDQAVPQAIANHACPVPPPPPLHVGDILTIHGVNYIIQYGGR